MAGRHFNAKNTAPPECVVKMSATVPACFKADVWAGFLRDTWTLALHDGAARHRMERGQVPDYCIECTSEHRRAMTAAGRCHPPPGAQAPAIGRDKEAPNVSA